MRIMWKTCLGGITLLRVAGTLSGAGVTALLIWGALPGARACEVQQKAGVANVKKFVNADVENNKLTVTITITKKGDKVGKEVRLIEMIGPKGGNYFDRFLLGGPHKKIPANQDSATVKYEITKNDIPNIRIGGIGDCDSCHADRPELPHAQTGDCLDCHGPNNPLPLDEWNDPTEFPTPTDQQFKDWVQGIADNGYAEYLDVTHESTVAGRTFNMSTAEAVPDKLPPNFDWYFYPHNHFPDDRWFFLLVDDSLLPPGWTLETIPPAGELFFLLADTHLPAMAILTPPASVPEGTEAKFEIVAVEQETELESEIFTYRAVRDVSPPTFTTPLAFLEGQTIVLQIGAEDQPATVAGAKVFYSLNGDPEASAYMDIMEGTGCDPVDFEYRVESLSPGTNTLQFFIRITDEVGNEVVTPAEEVVFEVVGAPIPTVSEWGLIVMALLVLAMGTIMLGRRRRVTAAG